MNLINANDLINSNIKFTIKGEESQFEESGELKNVKFTLQGYSVLNEKQQDFVENFLLFNHEDHVNEVDVGIELQSIDYDWHSHDSQQKELSTAYAIANRATESESASWNQLYYLARSRKDKYNKQIRYVDRCKDSALLRKCQEKLWTKWFESVKQCVKSGDWDYLYLTKNQASAVSESISIKRNALYRSNLYSKRFRVSVDSDFKIIKFSEYVDDDSTKNCVVTLGLNYFKNLK